MSLFNLDHRFQPLEIAHGGKQHAFTYRTADNDFIMQAMYQSGEDLIPLAAGGTARRGDVMRFQYHIEGNTHPDQSLALQITGSDWDHTDYICLARTVLTLDISNEQKQASLIQLASVYHLLSTRYALEFEIALPHSHEAQALAPVIIDPQMMTTSRAFEAMARDIAERGTTSPEEYLTTCNILIPDTSTGDTVRWIHRIVASEGAKEHPFFFQEGDTIRLETKYMSGHASGDSIQLLFHDECGGVTLALSPHLRRGTPNDFGVTLASALDQGDITADQAGLCLLMMASVAHLLSTRYGTPFTATVGYDGEALTGIADNTMRGYCDQYLALAFEIMEKGSLSCTPARVI